MQSQKKHRLLEGLIQAALLFSLCGVRVDVGLEPGPQSHLLLGPISALTPATRLHNLRNALESEGGEVHPKHPDLDLFFTSRRLLGWVRSLDRLQVPQTELETWLVQQEPIPLPVRLLHTAPNRLILPEEPQEPRGQGWEEPEHTLTQVYRQHMDPEEQHMDPEEQHMDPEEQHMDPEEQHMDPEEQHMDPEEQHMDPEEQHMDPEEQHMDPEEQHMDPEEPQDQGQAEDPLSSTSLWECLRLLEAFPLTQEQQELVCNTEAPAPPQSAPADMEQQWQDFLDLMEPQNGDVDMESLLEQTSGSPVTAPAEQGGPLMDAYVQHGSRSDQQLLPLLPSNQLEDLAPNLLHTSPMSTGPSFLLDEADLEELSGGLEDILGDEHMLEEMSLLDLELEEEGFGEGLSQQLQEQGYLDPELTQRTSRLSLSRDRNMEEKEDVHTTQPDAEEELDSDSGLSLDSSHSPSRSDSDGSSYSSSSSSTEPEVTVKEEPLDEEELGAVGGHHLHHDSKLFFSSQKVFDGFPGLEQISHDHTYNQPPKTASKHVGPAPKRDQPYHHPRRAWGRDERRARTLKIPFSNELIVSLPVEEFNDLLAEFQLDEDQLSLVRDIRRRGKNKIAAQNCRKRKMDTLQGLDRDVTVLRRRRSRLLKDKQEALKALRELKGRLAGLYQDVFSSLRGGDGQPLDVHEYTLSFESDGSVGVVSRGRRGKEKGGRKQKDKK